MTEQTKPINLDKVAERYTVYLRQYQKSEDMLDVFDYATACADDVPKLISEVERLRLQKMSGSEIQLLRGYITADLMENNHDGKWKDYLEKTLQWLDEIE